MKYISIREAIKFMKTVLNSKCPASFRNQIITGTLPTIKHWKRSSFFSNRYSNVSSYTVLGPEKTRVFRNLCIKQEVGKNPENPCQILQSFSRCCKFFWPNSKSCICKVRELRRGRISGGVTESFLKIWFKENRLSS